ncbi:MAG: hypothetical protein NVV74_14455 [Magnetospirillum sp.]|nr:hypothetical protein [Magnetospirillum sp.]
MFEQVEILIRNGHVHVDTLTLSVNNRRRSPRGNHPIIDEKAFPLVKDEQQPSVSATDTVEMLRRAVAKFPHSWDAHFQLGMCLRRDREMGASTRHLAKAAELVPADHPQAPVVHTCLGVNLLQTGNYALGWGEYEWRLRGPVAEHDGKFENSASRWQGEPAPNQILLLHYEQGLGDTINFCRYLKYPLMLGSKIVLFCQPPLRRLMAQSYGNMIYVLPHDTLPRVPLRASLLSLPYLLQPRIGSQIPMETPYLAAAPEDIERLRQRIDGLATGRGRLGLVWRGNPHNPTDGIRSIAPNQLRGLLSLNADFFVVQPDAKVEELRELGFANVHSLAADIQDFADTAAALTVLDGLISVDTSVVHLAGALDRPAWLLLSFPSDWRWGLEGDTTKWYPSLRLFRRQPEEGWERPLAQLNAALVQWLAARQPSVLG